MGRGPHVQGLRPLASTQNEVASHVSELSGNQPPALVKFMDDLCSCQHLKCNLMRDSEPEHANKPLPESLTHRQYMDNKWSLCFKLLRFGVICYVTID